jgi:hypothetical protein
LSDCTNSYHYSESELHLDLALEKQERLSKEMSKKMENKKLFDESEFAILYLQEYIHTCQDSVKTVEDMVKEAGKGPFRAIHTSPDAVIYRWGKTTIE